MPEEDPVRFGILQRYVVGEIFRAFSLALLTITCVFVLLTVMTKATSVGLGPAEIAKLVPYMIPPSLPYTIPVALLFGQRGHRRQDRRPERDGPDLADDRDGAGPERGA